MKFHSTIVSAALLVAGFQSSECFTPSASLSAQRTAVPSLQMVATNEVSVDGEVKGKKTREVGFHFGLDFQCS